MVHQYCAAQSYLTVKLAPGHSPSLLIFSSKIKMVPWVVSLNLKLLRTLFLDEFLYE